LFLYYYFQLANFDISKRDSVPLNALYRFTEHRGLINDVNHIWFYTYSLKILIQSKFKINGPSTQGPSFSPLCISKGNKITILTLLH